MLKVLVTGGAGFIGSHLTEALLSENNKVLIIDNFNDYYDPKMKENNIKEIKEFMLEKNISEENLELFRGDFRDKKFLSEVFSNEIDIIVHLAGMAGVRPSIEQSELYYDVNIIGTLNILEECRKHNIKKFIFASSSSVYGNNEKVPFSEADIVDNPISPYAATKKSGELLCHSYYHLYDMSIACLRFFTVYGPRQRPDLAIHKFSKLIKDGKDIPFFGDGSTSRDYTYISDIVDGILSTKKWIDKDEKQFDIFNLGGDKTITLKKMVETIEDELGVKAKLRKLPMQPGDVNRTCADITHSNKILGYSPKVKFGEGISNFIKWLEGK